MPVDYIQMRDGPFAAIKTPHGFVLAVANIGDSNESLNIPGITPPITQINVTSVVIPSGQSQSTGYNFSGQFIYKFVFPAAWTTAVLTFLESESQNGTYTPVYSDTMERSLTTAAASRSIRVLPQDYWGVKWLRLRSGTAATPVNQGANATILVYSYVL